MKAKAVF
jgi:hypothetical protein